MTEINGRMVDDAEGPGLAAAALEVLDHLGDLRPGRDRRRVPGALLARGRHQAVRGGALVDGRATSPDRVDPH